MKNGYKILIGFLIAIGIFVFAQFFCYKRCANWPMKHYPGIVDVIDSEKAVIWNQFEEDHHEYWKSFHLVGMKYSEFYFLTKDSLDSIISYVEANQCEVRGQAEYSEFSPTVIRLYCENDQMALLTFVSDGNYGENTVSYEHWYGTPGIVLFPNCFRFPITRGYE